jgi:hypothetical protein
MHFGSTTHGGAMTNATWIKFLNTIGLVLGILGTFLLFQYGLPQPDFGEATAIAVSDNTPLPDGHTAKEHGEAVRVVKAKYEHLSKLGIALVATGFVFQLIAIWIPAKKGRDGNP